MTIISHTDKTMEENIKQEWRDTRFRAENEYRDNLPDGSRRTALQNLARRYRIFSIIGLLMPLNIFMTFTRPELFPQPAGLWIGVSGSACMLISAVMDDWLCRGIQRIDCATMPVAEVARLAIFYRKRHLQFMCILIPLVLMWMAGVAWIGIGDIYFVACVVLGALTGLALGLMQFHRFMDDYRRLS